MKVRDLEAYALSLPGAALDFPFGEGVRVFKVGGKMFAACGGAPSAPARPSFKCSDLAFEMLVLREGLAPARYLARAKWIQIDDARVMGAAELKARIAEAHRIVAAKLPRKARPA